MITAPVITAVDTNVLLDLFQPDERFAAQSMDWLAAARQNGDLVICDLVYAELAYNFGSRNELDAALSELGAAVSPSIPTSLIWPGSVGPPTGGGAAPAAAASCRIS